MHDTTEALSRFIMPKQLMRIQSGGISEWVATARFVCRGFSVACRGAERTRAEKISRPADAKHRAHGLQTSRCMLCWQKRELAESLRFYPSGERQAPARPSWWIAANMVSSSR